MHDSVAIFIGIARLHILHTLGAVYINTEDAFPSKRLCQLAGVFSEQHSSNTAKKLTDNIFIEHTGTVVPSHDL